jgi:hypothetical protein
MTIKKGLFALALAGLLTFFPAKAAAENIGKRFSVGASYSYNFCDLLKVPYEQFNQDWENGKYTSGTLCDSVNAQPQKDLQFIRGNLDFKLLENAKKDLSLHLKGGYEQAQSITDINKSTITHLGVPFGDSAINLKIKETLNVKKPFIGIKVKKKLNDSLELNASGDIEFYVVDGKRDLTTYKPGMDSTRWYNITYSGAGMGFSAEADIAWNIFPWLSVSGGTGYKSGKVDVIGEERKWQDSWGPKPEDLKDWQKERDYNTTSNVNGMSLNFKISGNF